MANDKGQPKGGLPDDKAQEEAIRELIRQTIASMGETGPETLPHMVRERLKGQLTGDADLERICADVLREQRRARKG